MGSSFLVVLPVLFLEFLATSLTKGVLPHMLLEFFGDRTYSVIAVVETLKGLLAFYFCPHLGRLSDTYGRRSVLLFTVLGTCLPFCTLAFTENLWIYVAAQAVAGAFAATFAVTFAYIADTVDMDSRAPAYGLALATFGLSFCVGPVSGSYLAQKYSRKLVFTGTLVLTILDLIYVSLVLPETVPDDVREPIRLPISASPRFGFKDAVNTVRIGVRKVRSTVKGAWLHLAHGAGDVAHSLPTRMGLFISDAVAILLSSPLLRRVSEIVFLYYCGVWALVSTLMVFVTQHLHFTPIMVGQLLSAYGLCTMLSEGVLVRIMVPLFGEPFCVVLGLIGFTIQCTIIAFANEPYVIYCSMAGALLANLFYPSISALISKTVRADQQGEALGALNGIKSLCEGVGPLIFGTLMTMFEDTDFPGAPYLLAAVATALAAFHALDLPRLIEEDIAAQEQAGAQASEKRPLLSQIDDDDDDDRDADDDDDDDDKDAVDDEEADEGRKAYSAAALPSNR